MISHVGEADLCERFLINVRKIDAEQWDLEIEEKGLSFCKSTKQAGRKGKCDMGGRVVLGEYKNCTFRWPTEQEE